MGSSIVQSGILAAPLQVVIEKFATFAQKEIGLILDAEDEFKKLKRSVMAVEALVDNVKQYLYSISSNHEAIQLWLCDLQSALHDAEDLLDEIDLELMKHSSTIDDLGFAIRDEVSNLVFSQFKLGIPHEMAKIRHRLEEIAGEKDGVFRDQIVKLTSQPSNYSIGKLQTSSLVDDLCVIGREKDKNDIIRMLFSEETEGDDISVISIVGMAGVGKTTLAQLVYNDEYVLSNGFINSRIWISISKEDTVQTISESILESASGVKLRLSNLDIVQTRLQTSPRKFFIVLDGMWNENASDWDALCLPFKVAAKGSKILVTTRSMIVSRIVSRTLEPYHVPTLSDTECWDLIKQRALPYMNEGEHKELEEIGFRIAVKCGGLPLAARVIGSILHFKSDEMEWDAVLQSKLWDIADDANEVLLPLKLSYDYLPPSLKKCFAYCSIFPQNFEFKRDELVELWIAEGFVRQKAMRRIEDVGKDYFDLLVSRSLFQLSHIDHNNHPIYKMHDLIHELAQFVSDGVCFKMENNNSQPRLNFKYIRHSSFVCKDIQPETWKVFHKCDRLHTFILLHQGAHQLNQIPDGFFRNLCYMRVLNLSCTSIIELPDTIGTLKHLRHLNVSNTQIESLPESITNLFGLETINVINCVKFLHLPQDMRNLSNLRHLKLDIKRQIRSMPAQFGKLTSLQTLSAFIVDEEDGHRIEELKNLRCLRGSICITHLENVTNNAEAVAAELDQKLHLDKVELKWDEFKDGQAEQEVLAGLQPHNRIKELIITGYGGLMFPSWLSSPSFCKLQSIYLHKCCKCTILPFLGKLPLLSDLYIHDMSDLQNVNENFTSSSMCFPSLLTLKFNNMPKLQEWTGLTRGNMPKLSKLSIENCPILNSLPSLECLCSLETLDISRCPQLESLPNGNLPKSLKSLIITGCDILKQRCDKHNGQDWIKIMAISYIEIDYDQLHHAN